MNEQYWLLDLANSIDGRPEILLDELFEVAQLRENLVDHIADRSEGILQNHATNLNLCLLEIFTLEAKSFVIT
jgi:hypothetical protein